MKNTASSNNAHVRAREPISRSTGIIRGKFPSRKTGRMVHWESQLERDAVLLFEFSPGILDYREQPIKTHYTLDGKTRRYTPDFEITLHTGEVQLIEVKPYEKLLCPNESRRLARIQDHFRNTGNYLRIVTEKEIRQTQLLANLNLLHRYRKAPLTLFQKRMLKKRFGSITTITFFDASKLLECPNEVWHLMDQQILLCDLKNEVNEKTILQISKEGEIHAEIYI